MVIPGLVHQCLIGGGGVQEIRQIHALGIAQQSLGGADRARWLGGIIASFMEAIASLTVLGDLASPPPKPINLTVDYLRPGLPGTLNTRATVSRKGRRMASVETIAWLEDERKHVAKGLFHFLLV